ncbi:hypothetical protein D9758_005836 [Tetrapyrgos nigripes]|uniref:Uncharacterized protein n=1 Tax=Tetrapyrgos nigripes TaxID=182062 RepID=A0A8H5G2S5_9AGAR|nr:hypothetical protein D9758_005836 [Tetrapyrgos nigripes]
MCLNRSKNYFNAFKTLMRRLYIPAHLTTPCNCTSGQFGRSSGLPMPVVYIGWRAFLEEDSRMAVSIAQSSVFSVEGAMLAPVISLALGCVVFGFYALLFGLSTYFLCKNKLISRRELHLAWTTALFLISTFGALINASSGIMDAVVMYDALRTQNFGPFISYSSHDQTQTIITGLTYTSFVFANLIADAVLIHRCYIVWGSKKWIIVLPALASLAVNAIGFAADGMKTKGKADASIPSNFLLFEKGVNYQLAFYYANAVVNFILTMMIAGRIWRVGRQTQAYTGYSLERGIINDRYKAIIAISLECGLLYPIALVAHAAVEGNVDKISIAVNLTPVAIQMAGVAPTLILVRTCLGKSITEKVIGSQDTASTFQYNASRTLGSAKNLSSDLGQVQSIPGSQNSVHSNLEIRVEKQHTTSSYV